MKTVRVEQAGGIAVFNFTVEGNHNYFILAKEYEFGQSCVLVHNGDCLFHGTDQDSAESIVKNGLSEVERDLHSLGIFDDKGLSLLDEDKIDIVRQWAEFRALERNSEPAIVAIDIPEPIENSS